MLSQQTHELGPGQVAQQALLGGFAVVRALFRDKDGNPVDVTSPTLTITEAASGAVRVSAAAMDPGTDHETGIYSYTLESDGWEPGLYYFDFAGTDETTAGGPYTLAWRTTATIEDVSVELAWIRFVRISLKDLDATFYKLDLPIRKWEDDELWLALQRALSALNTSGPLQTSFRLNNCPAFDLLITGARLKALEAAVTLEAWNTYSQSDGSASLTIQRAQLLKDIVDSGLAKWQAAVVSWKLSMPPFPIGQGSSVFPFNIRRALGFLPNMKNLFANAS